MYGCAGKPATTIPWEHVLYLSAYEVVFSRRGAISSVHTFTFTFECLSVCCLCCWHRVCAGGWVCQRRVHFCWWVNVNWSVGWRRRPATLVLQVRCRHWTWLCLSVHCTTSVHSHTTSTRTSSTGSTDAPSPFVVHVTTAATYVACLSLFHSLLLAVLAWSYDFM